MFRYRVHLEDGSDAGEATYSVMIKPGEEILVGNGRRFRVLDLVPVEEEGSPYVGLLEVESAG
jgi:hypothetical protein